MSAVKRKREKQFPSFGRSVIKSAVNWKRKRKERRENCEVELVDYAPDNFERRRRRITTVVAFFVAEKRI